jgi:nucleoside-diphosphate-sugar epimerase
MRILVTGATGFLGRRLVEELSRRGHSLVALVRPTSDTRALVAAGVRLQQGAIEPGEPLDRALDGVEAIIHAAGGGRVHRTFELYEQNTRTTLSLLDAALRTPKLARFVLVSSLAARGPAPWRPGQGESRGIGPVSDYGKSKRAAESAVLALAGRLHVTVIRPPAIYGPGDDRFLPLFRAARRGIAPRVSPGYTSLVEVGDCARALADAVEGPQPSGRVYDDAEPTPLTWEEVSIHAGISLQTVPRVIPVPAPVIRALGVVGELGALVRGRASFLSRDKARDALAADWVGDPARLERELGWRARSCFAEGGAADTARWYRQEGLLQGPRGPDRGPRGPGA